MGAATGVAAVLLASLAILAPSARGLNRGEFPPGFLFGASTSAYQVSWCGLWSLSWLCLWRRRLFVCCSFAPKSQCTTKLDFDFRLRARTWRTARVSTTGMSSPPRTVGHLSLSPLSLKLTARFPPPCLVHSVKQRDGDPRVMP
jgi:hypothetical protein